MHSIRLRGPWKSEWLASEDCSEVSYRRTFHLPTGLDASQPVYLHLEPANVNDSGSFLQIRSISLNENTLPCTWESHIRQPQSIAITALLQTFNRLQLCVALEIPQAPGPISNAAEPPPLIDFLKVELKIGE